jgi:hypothetical protein
MKIPKYWSKSEGTVEKPDGEPLSLMAWGWSEDSVAAAAAHAKQRFGSLVDRVRQGLELPRGYAYGSRPLREQILEELHGSDGALRGLLTRNSYGSVVLNAAQAMFVDVDLPEGALEEKKGWFGSKSGGEAAALDGLRGRLQQSASGGFRVYRTAAGFRLLATDRLYAPASGDAERVMRAVGADPAFVQLCKVQDSFRARLTPKPWRCGVRVPPASYPCDSPAAERAYAEWLRRYEAAIASKATCAFVEGAGPGRTEPEARAIVAEHDRVCRVEESLPLA